MDFKGGKLFDFTCSYRNKDTQKKKKNKKNIYSFFGKEGEEAEEKKIGCV